MPPRRRCDTNESSHSVHRPVDSVQATMGVMTRRSKSPTPPSQLTCQWLPAQSRPRRARGSPSRLHIFPPALHMPSSGISVSPLPFFLALLYTCRLRLSIRRRRPAGSRSRTLFPLSSLPSDASTLSPFFLIASEPGQGTRKSRSCIQTYIFRCSG